MQRERPRVQRLLLRRSLRKQYLHATESERDLIQVALRDDAIFEPLYEQLMRDAGKFGDETGKFSVMISAEGAPVVDNLLKLLQWFVDHGPELVKVIELIVGLFGGIAEAEASWIDEQCFTYREDQEQEIKEQM